MGNDPLHIQIRQRFQLGPALHMTHIDNLSQILAAGGLKSYNAMQGTPYTNLANDDVQSGRAAITIPVSGRRLHDYVPLYFGIKTPMVACNQDKNEKMLFLRISLDILTRLGVVFTDGNARATGRKFFRYTNIDDLSILDVAAINSTKYAGDPLKKRRKQAEILVPDFLPICEVLDILSFSETARFQALTITDKFGITTPIRVNPGFYFRPATTGAVRT